jgi:F-type H+-transporting ATPase subunit a
LATESHGEAEVGLVFHPMDQFQVTPLFGADKVEWFTINNVTLWMGLTIAPIVLILVFGARGRA